MKRVRIQKPTHRHEEEEPLLLPPIRRPKRTVDKLRQELEEELELLEELEGS